MSSPKPGDVDVDGNIEDLVELVVKQGGRISLSVPDGTFLFLSTKTLEQLLAQAQKSKHQNVVVFVKSEMQS